MAPIANRQSLSLPQPPNERPSTVNRICSTHPHNPFSVHHRTPTNIVDGVDETIGLTMNIPVGIDLGSWNARIATYDEGLDHSVMVYNKDGHRTTRAAVVVDDDSGGSNNNADNNTVNVLDLIRDHVQQDGDDSKSNKLIVNFLNQILGLACDSSHAPIDRMRVVTSLAYDGQYDGQKSPSSSTAAVLRSCLDGDSCIGFCYEPIAVCLAYDPSPELKHLLVVDGGASGLKVSMVKQIPLPAASASMGTNDPGSESSSSSPSVVWSIVHHQSTTEVSGSHLVEQMGMFVAQQFETKHRFPKGEVWSSKKVQRKLVKACEPGLLTLYQSNNVTIHVDGLYEGMDCQVSISKPRWEMTSSKLANQAKDLIKRVISDSGITSVDGVFLSGNLHSWLRPLVDSALKSSLSGEISLNEIMKVASFDPSEAVALGCAKQAYYNLSMLENGDGDDDDNDGNDEKEETFKSLSPQQEVLVSPVSIGFSARQTTTDEKQADDSDSDGITTTTLIERGTPLPAVASFRSGAGGNGSCEVGFPMTVWQLEPCKKQLAVLDNSSSDNCDNNSGKGLTVRVQLTRTGQLTIAAGGKHITIGG